jgi:HTH-type transcriptional regulator, sugar sensing transcriptional regulator
LVLSMRTIHHNNTNNNELAVSLEEFGLSKYEAKAYLTMNGKGSLAASEIAYYSNLPRTKIYPTLKKLEKKKLSVISQQKPLICSAIPPQEAFGEIVELHERRSKNMKKIVDILQRINDEVQNPTGSEERRYCILDPKSALEKVSHLLADSRSSINAILDVWGVRLISQCKQSLLRAVTNGIKIRLIIANECVGNESLLTLPEGIDLKIADVFSNTIIIDANNMILVDSSNGKAAVFTSIDIFGLSQLRNFEEEWDNAMGINRTTNNEPDIVLKAIQLTKTIENGLSSYLFAHTIYPTNDSMGVFVKSMEKSGIKILDADVHKVLNIIDLALRMKYSGSLKHDKSNNILIIQSKLDNKPILPWAVLLTLYFKYLGNESKIMQNSKQGSSTEIIHIKLSKPIL